MTPRRSREGGAGTLIRFDVGQCTRGAIPAASGQAGICVILVGEDPDVLVRDLKDRLPRANLVDGDRTFAYWMAKVIGFVDAPGAGLDPPSTQAAPRSSSACGER